MQPLQTVVHVTTSPPEDALPHSLLYNYLQSLDYIRSVKRTLVIGLASVLPAAPFKFDSTGRFGTALSLVRRKYHISLDYCNHACGTSAVPVESVHIDPTRAEPHSVNALKAWLYEECGLDSLRFEADPDYDRAVRLAPAALGVLRAIGAADPSCPAVLIAHDELALPLALAATMDPLGAFKTIFHVHRVTPVQDLVDSLLDREPAIYSTMQQARQKDYYLPELFGPQDDNFRYQLFCASRFCDHLMADSTGVRDELQFLSPLLQATPIHVLPSSEPQSASGDVRLMGALREAYLHQRSRKIA